MIDMVVFNGSIVWLQRDIEELDRDLQNNSLREHVTHSFEVTYNIAERVLRQTLRLTQTYPAPSHLSSRELMRFAREEGLKLSTGDMWLRYGLVIELAHETLGDSFARDILPLLPHYLRKLQEFAPRLEARLVQLA